jgi:hydrogenase maturation protease
MNVKLIFIGNIFGGDDGIGPYLYTVLKDDKDLSKYDLLELGVIGFDLIAYIKPNDIVIIIDAKKTNDKDKIGTIEILKEKDLTKDVSLVSQHDFSIEQTVQMIRTHCPEMKQINVIGINVEKINEFNDKLSNELTQKLEEITKEVKNKIFQIINEVK